MLKFGICTFKSSKEYSNSLQKIKTLTLKTNHLLGDEGIRRVILTAFLPWILHALHVLHSMHCHLKAFTFVVSSGQNFKQDGCPTSMKAKCFMEMVPCIFLNSHSLIFNNSNNTSQEP